MLLLLFVPPYFRRFVVLTLGSTINRVFPGWWGDASEGEEYITEFDCPAIDAEGNKYRVIWRFDAIKGSEPEDNGGWLWEDVSEVREDD